MSDELDFSELSDDQVVGLAVALAREAMRRNPALQAAFAQALLNEREKVDAAARGHERARRAEAERIERQAAAAANAEAMERERRRVHDGLAAYLRAAAAILGHNVENLTLVWKRTLAARGGVRLQVNLGGERANWHLVDYGVSDGTLHVSPGLRGKQVELLAWCREVVAAVDALGIDREFSVKGVEA